MVKIAHTMSKHRKAEAEQVDEACRDVIKRFKERRTKILKQSLKKLKRIPDAERCLRQAVLIRNTFIKAKDYSPKQFERHLLTQPVVINDIHNTVIIDNSRTTVLDYTPENDHVDEAKENIGDTIISQDCSNNTCSTEQNQPPEKCNGGNSECTDLNMSHRLVVAVS